MRRDHCAGDGKPDAIAADLGIARAVSAVKAVKQVAQFLLADRLHGVEHRKMHCFALPFEHYTDLAAVI